MRNVRETLLVVVDGLYEAALRPSHWPQALEELARACGASGATVSRGTIPEPALASPSLEASTADYASTWWRHDNRQKRISALFRGDPLTEADVLEPGERERDPFYQEFLRAYGLESFAAVVLEPLPGMRLGLTVERGAKPFNRTELRTLAFLSSHISRALAVTVRLGLSEAFANSATVATEHVPCGTILLSPEGKVTFMNAVAQRLLGGRLSVSDGRLRADAPDDQAKLDRVVECIRPGSLDAGATTLVGGQRDRRALVVRGLPLPYLQERSLQRLGLASGGGLLLLHDLASEMRPIRKELEFLGLTPAQARIAEAVGQGRSVKEAADLAGVVESTARTQLKAAYARLGIGRQSELAILVTKLASIAEPTMPVLEQSPRLP